MKHKLLRYSSIAASLVFVAVFFGLAILNTPGSDATVKATDFKAGRIIDDEVFYNKNTMTVAEIQAFLDKYTPTCDVWGTKTLGAARYHAWGTAPASMKRADYAKWRREVGGDSRYHDPPYVCVNLYYENPTTHETNFDTNFEKKEDMLSAAEIIYQAAQKYNINPQVLLVMLKKESYAWGDDWPIKWGYNTIMGYGCPDTAPCDEKYYGFYNQMMMAAWQMNYYKDHIYSYGYFPYAYNNIYYSPTLSCGTKRVYLENIATTSLYIYTPYTPNDAALKNYPGTATCGSYGNRNFFMYFNEWFGTTLTTHATISLNEGDYTLALASDKSKTLQLVKEDTGNGIKYTVGAIANNKVDIFTIKKKSNGNYNIINKYSDKALDIPSGDAISGKELQQYTQNGLNPQEWKPYDNGDGTFSLASVITGNLVVSIAEDGKVVLAPYKASDDQRFVLQEVETANSEDPSTTAPTNETPTTETPNPTTETPTVETPTYTATIEDGEYRIASAITHSYMLDVSGGLTAENSILQMYQRNGMSPQNFKLSFDKTTGYYTIKASYTDKYVSAKDDGTANFTRIVLHSWTGSCGQYWKIVKKENGNYNIYNKCSEKALDVHNGIIKLNGVVQLYQNNNLAPQEWKFENTSSVMRPLDDGVYSIASVLRSNYMLDVSGGIYTNGRNIQMWQRNNLQPQMFRIAFDSKVGYYTIQSYYGNKYLDVSGARTANGTNVQLWAWTGACAQYWKIVPTKTGTYNIFNQCSGKSLDVSGGRTAAGTNVQIWQMNWLAPQEWKFEKK